jgi:hypothetical protein
MNELPEWGIPFYEDKYTGPYWSDGKWQSSVNNGKHKPKSKLEGLSKRHDASYKNANDILDLLNADVEYLKSTQKLGVVPKAVGLVPITANFVYPLLNNFWSIAPDLVYAAVKRNIMGGKNSYEREIDQNREKEYQLRYTPGDDLTKTISPTTTYSPNKPTEKATLPGDENLDELETMKGKFLLDPRPDPRDNFKTARKFLRRKRRRVYMSQ